MAIVCSNCDVAPAAGAGAGDACAACGERLLAVDTGDELIGTKLDGRFEILAKLGQGGMGVVYRAKQLSIGREVAIKVLDRRFEKDVAAIKRFFREAKLATTLQHPNTVPIIDFGQTAGGRLYLAMELIKGRTLHDEVNAVGALPLPRIAAIGSQLCDALEAAHELHIVHRDLKLDNVMLLDGKRDHVKVLDFGLARSLVDPTTAMTATGLISGTPRYMAPEGMGGAPPAPSQDIYALGVMLAELSMARPLWEAPTLEAMFVKKTDLGHSLDQLPAPLRPLVRSMLAEEPTLRPTAGQVRQLLRGLDGHAPVTLELDDAPAPRVPRAHSPIALEPTADIKVEVSTTPDPFAALENVDTVSLDELPAAPAAMVLSASIPVDPTVPSGPPPGIASEPDPRFEVPSGSDIKASDLQIDPRDLQQRSPKLAASRRPPPIVKKKSKLPAILVTLLLLGGLGAGGYYYWFHYRKKPVQQRLDGPGVTITIEADGEHAILVDGKAAGTTPVRLQVPQGKQPIMITGDGVIGTQVVPDRDQTIVLEKP